VKLFSKVSAKVTSGLTKLKLINMENASEVTSVSKYICPHGEHVSYNISIWEPVSSTTSHEHLLKVCPSCAAFIVEQVSEILESTSRLKLIDRWDSECLVFPTSFGGTE
jgi:hypothetical protein